MDNRNHITSEEAIEIIRSFFKKPEDLELFASLLLEGRERTGFAVVKIIIKDRRFEGVNTEILYR